MTDHYLTVQDVIDKIIAAIPGEPREDTVDNIKTGKPGQKVTGIVTTFLATLQVLQKTVELGANLVITHEPTFYNHLDEQEWLKDDPVYEAKRRFIEEHQLAIWRFHDYWHRHNPDGVLTGTLKRLGWEDYVDPLDPTICVIPSIPLSELVPVIKEKLGVQTARIMGDPNFICQRVAVLVGAWGGRTQILTLGRDDVDTLVCGEIAEWETTEYVRDATQMGRPKALVVVGHANSEEPGMEYLVEWLQKPLPNIPIHHLATGNPFWYG